MSRGKKLLNQIEEEGVRIAGLHDAGSIFRTRITMAICGAKRCQCQLFPSDLDIPFGSIKFQAHNIPFLTYAAQLAGTG